MTPEERLFKAVQTLGPTGASAGKGKRLRLPPLSSPSEWIPLLRQLRGPNPIRRINQGFLVLLGILFLYLLVDAATAPSRFGRFLKTEELQAVGLTEQVAPESTLAPLEEVLSAVQKRDPFLPAGAARPSASASQPARPPAEGLRLVGIAWGPEPEAMIVDGEANRTLFLKERQRIRSLTVEKITPESVTLKTEAGELVELR